MQEATTIVWFRRDLRLADQPALDAAVNGGGPVLPFFLCPDGKASWAPGGASRWWLHQSLKALDRALRRRGSRLTIRRGRAEDVLPRLIADTGATAVVWSRRYEPGTAEADRNVAEVLEKQGVQVGQFSASLIFEPWDITTGKGGPYKVFTPFWKQCLAAPEPAEPLPAPASLPAPVSWPDGVTLDALDLDPGKAWTTGLAAAWQPGEDGAHQEMQRFLDEALHVYPSDRDRPDRRGTSRLSPHLHFGEISPRTLWHAVKQQAMFQDTRGLFRGAETYLRQVGWREFAHHLLYHFPATTEQPLRPDFRDFPWQTDANALKAWQQGRTGYPIVDAGMRELWATGWMHNRVRMIVASFLVKDLLIPWQDGARWFWDTLVDADLANNTLGWQWTAGCGADAAPFFRIFNPVLQGKKFDPEGAYVRRWVPALAELETKWIHAPWKAPDEVLRAGGVTLGREYPRPIVDHAEARDRALEAYAAIKMQGG